MLCELETDKVSVEVPAPAAGTFGEILAGEGDTVEAGGKLAVMSTGAGAAPAALLLLQQRSTAAQPPRAKMPLAPRN